MAGLYLQVEVLELDDDRLIEAGMEGRGAYLTVGLLAKRTETDGWVTMAQLRKEGVTAEMLSDLFGWGLLDDDDGRVRQVGWLDRNPNNRDGRAHIPNWLRRLVYERDGFVCLNCGATAPLSLDHIIPWSKGGPDRADNLRTFCRPCNSSRGAGRW